MDCKTANELLPLYFDGELDRANGRELEAHLDECAECRAVLIGLDGLRRTLREDAPRQPAPELLRARIRKEIAQRQPVSSDAPAPSRRPASRWLALAASWVVAFAAGGALMSSWRNPSNTEQPQVVRDLFASHWRALAANAPYDVVSTDQHTVKPWFAGKIAVAPLVQDFAEQGYALAGGRIDYVGHERVPVLVYRHGHHLIDVFILPPADAPATDKPIEAQGYVLDTVLLGGQPAAVVSDMGQAELAHFTQLLNSAK